MARLPARPGDNAPTWLRPSAHPGSPLPSSQQPCLGAHVSPPPLLPQSCPVPTWDPHSLPVLGLPHPPGPPPNLAAPFSPLQLRGRFSQNLPISLDHAPHLLYTRPFSSNPTLETRPTSHIRGAPRGTGAEDLPAPPTQGSHWNPHLHPQDCPASPTPPLTPPPSSGAQVPVPGGQSGGNLGCGLTPRSSLFSPPVSWTTMMRPR